MVAITKQYAAPAKAKESAKLRAKQAARRSSTTAGSPRAKLPKDQVPAGPVKTRRHRATSPEDFKTSMLNIRVKDTLKEAATSTLERIGISLPEAVRVFLGRVVSEQAFPFPLHVPNAETAAALRESMASDQNRASDHKRRFPRALPPRRHA